MAGAHASTRVVRGSGLVRKTEEEAAQNPVGTTDGEKMPVEQGNVDVKEESKAGHRG